MCKYSISVDDKLLEQVRPAFADNAEISSWMQSQIEALLLQVAAKVSGPHSGKRLSQRLRGIAASAPKDFDYKRELEKRY